MKLIDINCGENCLRNSLLDILPTLSACSVTDINVKMESAKRVQILA